MWLFPSPRFFGSLEEDDNAQLWLHEWQHRFPNSSVTTQIEETRLDTLNCKVHSVTQRNCWLALGSHYIRSVQTEGMDAVTRKNFKDDISGTYFTQHSDHASWRWFADRHSLLLAKTQHSPCGTRPGM